MTITHEDAARLRIAAQKRCDAAYQQLCDDIHAMVVADAQNEEWAPIAQRALPENTRLTAEVAALSAHLETVATERDRLMQRVVELEKMIKTEHSRTRPTIVCLCGSTKFYHAFQCANFAETMQGKIVLSVGFYAGSPDQMIIEHGEGVGITPAEKEQLDQLHLRKIDLADEVLILNVGGYIGESTRRELRYALDHGKVVRFLEEPMGTAPEHLEDTLEYDQ